MSTKKITIGLDNKRTQAFEKARGLMPLPEVVKQAVKILNPGVEIPDKGERMDCPFNSRWLTMMALRAVAEAIIRNGRMPFPLRVDFDYGSGNKLPIEYAGSGSDLSNMVVSRTNSSALDKSSEGFMSEPELPTGPVLGVDVEMIEVPIHPEFRSVAKSIGFESERLAYLLCWAAMKYPLLARFMLRFNK